MYVSAAEHFDIFLDTHITNFALLKFYAACHTSINVFAWHVNTVSIELFASSTSI
jgi:hypothetical protein